MNTDVRCGRSAPLGASVQPDGDAEDAPRPSRTIALDPARHRTDHYWHAPAVAEDHYLVQPRAMAFLVAPTTGIDP